MSDPFTSPNSGNYIQLLQELWQGCYERALIAGTTAPRTMPFGSNLQAYPLYDPITLCDLQYVIMEACTQFIDPVSPLSDDRTSFRYFTWDTFKDRIGLNHYVGFSRARQWDGHSDPTWITTPQWWEGPMKADIMGPWTILELQKALSYLWYTAKISDVSDNTIERKRGGASVSQSGVYTYANYVTIRDNTFNGRTFPATWDTTWAWDTAAMMSGAAGYYGFSWNVHGPSLVTATVSTWRYRGKGKVNMPHIYPHAAELFLIPTTFGAASYYDLDEIGLTRDELNSIETFPISSDATHEQTDWIGNYDTDPVTVLGYTSDQNQTGSGSTYSGGAFHGLSFTTSHWLLKWEFTNRNEI